MANAKSIRSEVEFPPLLNLQEDRPRIASDFRSVEHNNAPYINGMLTPLWKKEYEFTNRPVYDYKNSRYEVKDGWLTKDGEDLFQIENKHFEKEDVTEEYNKYMAFDLDVDDQLAYMEWNKGLNSAKLVYGNSVLDTGPLYANGVILTARVRCFNNGNGQKECVGVIAYEVDTTQKIAYIETLHSKVEKHDLVWYFTQPKPDASIAFKKETIQILSPSPVINICPLKNDSVGVSLVSNYGDVLFTRVEGFYTFIHWNEDSSNSIHWGQDLLPQSGSATETIKKYQIANFAFDVPSTSMIDYVDIYMRDGVWYFASNPDSVVPDSVSIYFTPIYLPNQKVTYDGKEYQMYRAKRYSNRISFTSFVDNTYGKEIYVTVSFSDGTISEKTKFVDNVASMTHKSYSWYNSKIRVDKIDIDFGGTIYSTNSISNYSIIQETSPETISASYVVAPNVFLDNGNMYSFYTIPSAPEFLESLENEAKAQPMVLPENCLIIESGTLNSFDTSNHTYSVNAIEAHLTNSFCPYPRENSIAVGQNFWNSSIKFASKGIRSPYEIYVAKTAAETISESVKYTEYSNSNCSDMLYYAGTCPRNDQKFYKYASNNSEDVAWFNPGGFRAPLKNGTPWNILYYVDSTGAVAVQGVSYSKYDDAMGTLVTPFASPAKVQYIAGGKNSVIFVDGHERIYKITIKDGAQISSIFDNHYIIVNTTSYWNMWDAQRIRKFHYATDYNNRAKIGYTRSVYRANAAKLYTLLRSRKMASAINPNYSVLPRLPVSSVIPGANALAHWVFPKDYVSNIHVYNSICDEARETQPIDIFCQGEDASDVSVMYTASVKPYVSGNQIYRDSNLELTSYTDSKAILAVADILSKFIDGAGNHSLIVEGSSKYVLTYNNQNKPTFLYSLVTGIDVDDVKWFFVIQGQYYAVIGEKLYAMIYSNGMISQSDAIVDVRDLKFVGNTPAIAFFVNPYTKQVYSFTGDANLQSIFSAGKYNFQFTVPEKELKHFYDESTQSIYMCTDEGLLVFGPDNTYCLEDYKDVHEIVFVDGDIHIIENNGKETILRYYHDRDGYDPLQIELETSFWGLGADESTSIDRWSVTLYDTEHKEQDVYLQVRTLTNVSTQTEEKKLHINANDWDKYTHSVLVNFTPALIKGQGIRLTIKTISNIQKIVTHVMDNKTSQPTNSKFNI